MRLEFNNHHQDAIDEEPVVTPPRPTDTDRFPSPGLIRAPVELADNLVQQVEQRRLEEERYPGLPGRRQRVGLPFSMAESLSDRSGLGKQVIGEMGKA